MPTPRRTQAERSHATRTALLDAGRTLFVARGFHDVPADEIVRAAGVTRGALYHHYEGKQGLFRDVFEQLEEQVTAEVAAAAAAAEPDARMVTALAVFLDLCQRPEVRRISLVDAPAVLGWAEWRAIEGRHGLGLITELLESAAAEGRLVVVPTPALAQVVLSSVIEAALYIGHAPDPARAREEAERALLAVLGGLISSSE